VPLYGLGLWGQPSFEPKGMSFRAMKRFTELTQPMLIASMDDDGMASPEQQARIVDWLRRGVLSGSMPVFPSPNA
jgi:hypothetical protein